MGLNKIELPAVVVEELYHSSLIDTNSDANKQVSKSNSSPTQSSTEPEENGNLKWKSLGNNNKKILIAVKSEDAVYLSDNQLTFLTGILSACKLSLADVAIVNCINYPDVTYKELTAFFSSKIVILFDIEPSVFGLPMSFPYYQIQAFAGNSFLYSPSLNSLEDDKIEKSKLWVSLKRLFNL